MKASKPTVTKALQRAGFDVEAFRYGENTDGSVNVTARFRGHVRVFLNRDLTASICQLAQPDASGFDWELTPEFRALAFATARRVVEALTDAGFYAVVCTFVHAPASGGEAFVEVLDS